MSKRHMVGLLKPVRHRHRECLQAAISAAKRHCDIFGLRLTPVRQRVLELIWQNHQPVKAYDILDQLKQRHASSAPPTVYRALNFLQEEGLVHKIESLNAYVGCGNPVDRHQGQFFICDDCNFVAELNDTAIRDLIQKTAARFGFKINDEMVEIKGYCQKCNPLGQ